MSLDVINIVSGLPAMPGVGVHFSGRYNKNPWPQPLMDWNGEEASHMRAIEEFCGE